MTEPLKTDPSEINKFIFDAATKKQPIFDAYKSLYEIQKMDYVDFEWRYYQFYHGNRDLTIERSSENSSTLTFSDLPMNILEDVVRKLPLFDCLSLRKVSKDLRNLVDDTEVHSELIEFRFKEYSSRITHQNLIICYEQDYEGCRVVAKRKDSREIKTVKKENRNFEEMMVADASTFLKNPKLKIDNISLTVDENYENPRYTEFLEFLKSLNFKLHVRSALILGNRDCILQFLQLLEPKTLEEISIDNDNLTIDEFNEIAETEQWKMAKKLNLDCIPEGFRMEKMLHFKEIEIDFFVFTDENFIMVRDILLKSAHLELCQLSLFQNNLEECVEEMDRIDRIMSQNPESDSATRQFSISSSMEFCKLTVTIRKISEN